MIKITNVLQDVVKQNITIKMSQFIIQTNKEVKKLKYNFAKDMSLKMIVHLKKIEVN